MPDSAAPSHHTRRGFRNPHSNDAHGGWDALRWLPGFLPKPYRHDALLRCVQDTLAEDDADATDADVATPDEASEESER